MPTDHQEKPSIPNNQSEQLPEDPAFADTGTQGAETRTSSPIASVPSDAEKKEDSNFLRFVKKVAFSIWAVVMAIGMVLAFLISLLLV